MRPAALMLGAGAAIAALAAYAVAKPDALAQFDDELGDAVSPIAYSTLSAIETVIPIAPSAQEFMNLADHPNVRAFLAVIRHGEGTAGPTGYRMMFGGELVDHLADHPRKAITRLMGGRPITSTAAGAYQFLARTWDEARAALGLVDFSAASQDAAAVWLIRRRGALADVIAGRFAAAVAKCAREWASLPGSPYGQPTISLAQGRGVYAANGGIEV